jgi:hypothetical protein
MSSGTPTQKTEQSIGPSDFSLVLGGPVYQLLRRAYRTDDVQSLAKRRAVIISLVAWLPLFVLSLVQGSAFKGSVAVPFLYDLEVHIRFLAALPLLVIAELIVHQRMRTVVKAFRDRNMIPEKDASRFDAAVESAFRLRNSLIAELLLAVLVYVVGIQVIWRQFVALGGTATWYSTPSGDGTSLTVAGAWFGYVSLPIFQFLLLRWYFRVFIWARFLLKVSRIELALVPTHPDRMGGLGFLANTVYAFTPLALAHGVMLAGPISSRIFYAGAKLSEFRMEAGALVLGTLLVVFGPLTVFAPQLAEARRRGMREYGDLAERYVRAFDTKWLRGGASTDESLLGSGDIQSLADLGNSLEVVRGMRTFPITREALFQLGFVTFAPIIPLALTMMPLEELLKKLFGLMF